jgi:hypothetical protein
MSVPKNKWSISCLVLLLAFALTSCSGVALDNLLPKFGSDENSQLMVEVTFYVQIPLNTPEGEGIYLSTLDEVTGLGVNAEAHLLEPALGEANLYRSTPLLNTAIPVKTNTL